MKLNLFITSLLVAAMSMCAQAQRLNQFKALKRQFKRRRIVIPQRRSQGGPKSSSN